MIEKIGRFSEAAYLFFHITAIGYGTSLPLLGSSTLFQPVSFFQLTALVGVGIAFHIYTYLLNDSVDLPVDRLSWRRQGDPLVTGMVKRWQALLIGLMQIPIILWLTTLLNAPPLVRFLTPFGRIRNGNQRFD